MTAGLAAEESFARHPCAGREQPQAAGALLLSNLRAASVLPAQYRRSVLAGRFACLVRTGAIRRPVNALSLFQPFYCFLLASD
jgi:hypothetical protein